MGLSVRDAKGQNCPVLTCDTCGKPIRSLKKALAVFPMPDKRKTVAVGIFHSGACDPGSMPGFYDDKYQCSEGLHNYLPWLLWNHKWGTQQKGKITINVPEPIYFRE